MGSQEYGESFLFKQCFIDERSPQCSISNGSEMCVCICVYVCICVCLYLVL